MNSGAKARNGRGNSSRFTIPAPARQGLADYPDGTPWHVNFSLVDTEGPYSWPTENPYGVLLPVWLHALNRSLDLPQLLRERVPHSNGSIHHAVPAAKCSKAAQDRLQNLVRKGSNSIEQIFSESLFSLRYCLAPDSKERVWGILEDNVFYALWWDPNHEVDTHRPDARKKGNCYSAKCLHLTNDYEQVGHVSSA